ncbi:hypothetical protein BABA_19006 [Neobacillus bataviensis LMG 21833]|uniref:Uncharacterized protein n=1 Tax=Neobacillus bataviensis LMG 21833 TaxID=1117379 RepID=K6CZQ4_9BACI|nr:hypothetical protein [Neobacillus bataviensis]EKN65712.1 hypothetical protein BABA_19006 [Neobacillus bataviensis LMG 21833]
MKQFFVAVLLAFGMLSFMVLLDLKLGVAPKGIIWKTINPFRVMEPAEYIILFLFILFFLIQALFSFIKKKQQGNQA